MTRIRPLAAAFARAALLAPLSLAACYSGAELDDLDVDDRKTQASVKYNTNGYSLHLTEDLRFDAVNPNADVARGQAVFGLAEDGINEDKTEALFEGESFVFGGPVVSNERTCFTCHRGPDVEFGLPDLPLSDHVAADDALFTGINADSGGDPDGLHNLDELGLIKYRINRLNPTLQTEDPFKQVFGWRKTPQLLNIGLAHGFLNDGRGRVMFETARGAVFSHTQETDNRFDDMIMARRSDFDDMEAFLFSLVSQPELLALRDPNDPMHDALANDPFYTVDLDADDPDPWTKKLRKTGKKVFKANCMGCHDTPNVFNNLASADGTGNGTDRPEDFAALAPSVGRTFNVGVAEQNVHGLRFTRFVGLDINDEPVYEPIVLQLANEDGSINEHEVTFDIGLAATTARTADIGRFKVPQLRNLAANAPYFHDNSAATLEDVVDYFNSDAYND
ncbi:MAG: hypothetical protein R3A51_10380, partial [Nannocystaceae bacterium]